MSEVTFTLSWWHLISIGGLIFGGITLGWKMYLSLLKNNYDNEIKKINLRINKLAEDGVTEDSKMGKRITDMQISTDMKINEKLEPINSSLQQVVTEVGKLAQDFHKLDKQVAVVQAKQGDRHEH